MKKALFVILILAVIIGTYYFFKIEKRRLMKVPGSAVSLEFPLTDGRYQAVQSGPNGSTHALPVEKYALDIVRQSKLSDYFKFRQSDLESDATFNTPVYSPCTGDVTIAVDGFADMPIGIEGQADESNHVTVDCGQFYVAMVHFKKDSILVKVGDMVTVGQKVGLIGNSGHTSGPHLHLMAYRIGSSPEDRIALPMTFDGKYLFRGDVYP